MAKKQTRRSISIERRLYDLTNDRAETLGTNMSAYITGLIQAEMTAAGVELPTPLPPRTNSPFLRAQRRVAEAKVLLADVAPAVAMAINRDPSVDPKYAAALEFTRAKLAKEQAKPLDERESKAGECWWCGDTFKPGEIPTIMDGNQLHGKCKREVDRLPGGIEP